MVEMALVLPILVVLAIGIVDFGRAMNYWNDVNQLAADGARFAAVNRNPGDDPATTPTVEMTFRDWLRAQAVTGELREGELENGEDSESVVEQLRICIESGVKPGDPPEPLTVGHPIRIRVETNYVLVPLHMLPGIEQEEKLGVVSIHGEAVMRLEQNYNPDIMGEPGCEPA